MTNKAKIVILSLTAVVLIAAGIGAYFLFFNRPAWDEAKAQSFLTNSQLQDDYNNALAAEKRTKEFPKTTYNYVQAAFYWKTIADVTKEEMFYQRALDTYLLAIKKAEKSSVVYTSAGNIYRILKNPSKAEEMYRMALEMTPGEAELYIRLAELYRYDMNKSVDDVLKIYEEGMKKIVAPAPLLISKAAYLRDVGKKDEAMEIFEYLYAETGNEIYHDEIEDIKQS